MAKQIKAKITPTVLVWARNLCNLSLDEAADRAKVSESNLGEWEKGEDLPSITQARKLASIYKVPLISLWLNTPPTDIKIPKIRDFRRLPGAESKGLSYNLTIGIREASTKRDLAFELAENLKRPVKAFTHHFETGVSAQSISPEIRRILSIQRDKQKEWKDPRIAFNKIKEKVEALDILVFQYSKISVSEFRGFSIYHKKMPIIGVNRKDSPAARTFTLIHEFIHLLLGESSVSNISEIETGFGPHERIEKLCNEAAGSALVPSKELRDELGDHRDFSLTRVSALSNSFGVSRETIAMRLFQMSIIDQQGLNILLDTIRKSYKKSSKKGFVLPHQDFVSKTGKPIARLLLDNLSRGHITENDFSDYSGLKIKHIQKVGQSVMVPGD